ncbi:MAG: DUF4190 domain-containing protein [Verrucomicrobiota bacterium]|nr:DUF4190 domain-containing protein [Verrucomicrobiota bacterium]
MYTILGKDGQEYGPVTEAEVRQWIAEGRVSAVTPIRKQDAPEWRPAREFVEFAEALRAHDSPNAPPRIAPEQPVAPGQPAGSVPQGKTSGLAIASLVLGILGIVTCGLTAVAGLILGIVALNKSSKTGDRSARGFALAGTIVSAVFLVLLPLLAGMLLPGLAAAKQKASSISCISNVKQLCLGLMIYADENNGTLPSADKWCDAIISYVGNETVFKCPEGAGTERAHYGFNRKLSGVSLKQIESPATTVMIFEVSGGWNSSGGADEVLATPRHKSIVIGFADGHCETVPVAGRLKALRWDP